MSACQVHWDHLGSLGIRDSMTILQGFMSTLGERSESWVQLAVSILEVTLADTLLKEAASRTARSRLLTSTHLDSSCRQICEMPSVLWRRMLSCSMELPTVPERFIEIPSHEVNMDWNILLLDVYRSNGKNRV